MTYSAEVLADSPLLYWRFGDASGTTATDSSGNSRNGSYVGSPTLGAAGLLTGDADTAVTLNGTSQYATIAGASWQDIADYSVELWFKTTATSGFLCSRDDFTTKVWDLQLSSGKLQFTTFTASIGQNVFSTNTYNDGVRHHVVLVKSGTSMQIWVDGVQDGSGTFSNYNTSASEQISVGRRNNNTGLLAGTVDEFAYGAALSSTRIGAHYTAGSTSGSTNISVSDTGSGVDAIAAAAQVPIADTGSAADDIGVSAQLALGDTAAFTDSISVTVLVSLDDAGASVESIDLTAAVALVDVATGVDDIVIGEPIDLTDDGTGTDTLTATVTLPLDDAATGADEFTVTAALTLDDAITGVDDLTVQVLLTLDDPATGIDAVTAGEVAPPRDITLAYSLGTGRWTATTASDRWTATIASDRWAHTLPGEQP